MQEFDPIYLGLLIGGLFVALLVVGIAWGVVRRRRKLEGEPLRPGVVTAPTGERALRSVETMPAAAAPLEPVELPSDELVETIARAAEPVPAITPPARPHTIEEIQRKTAKPLSSALENTRASFFGRLKTVFSKKEMLKANELDDVEEILYTSDLGPQTVQRLMTAVEGKLRGSGESGFEAVRTALKGEMMQIFATIDAKAGGNGNSNSNSNGQGQRTGEWAEEKYIVEHAAAEYLEGLEHLNIWSYKPAVLMIVGVNGAGKTTTIGKLARRIAQSGRKVLVAAGDTFRAAAGDQLKVWVERAAVEIFAPEGVTDPSAVAFDACQTASAKGVDVVIIDTAGRLHTQKNLMEELKKMQRVIAKVLPGAPHEILLVLDANSGQNALIQAREFHSALGVTGVVLTKLDGTAKGGVAVGLACELGLPIKLIGVGERIEDLRRFSSQEFVDSII